MNSEKEIITGILTNFRKSPQHKNDFFQSDAEIISLGSQDYLVTLDSYSDEDHFRLNDPFTLGMNLAACTLSDIFACGGKPIFFCNSLNCENRWDASFIDNLSKGVAAVLDKCGTAFIGGDFGFSYTWNFTGVAIGQAERIVTRKGASNGDLIYLSGEVGRGNFEAASILSPAGGKMDELFRKNPVIFPVRIKEASLVSRYATSSIDTSDGLFRSLDIISGINNCGFTVSGVPYCHPGLEWAKCMNLPVECLAFGECGEYELLFTVKPADEVQLLKDASLAGCRLFRIGTITDDKMKILHTESHKFTLNDFNIYARDFTDHYRYIALLTEYLLTKGEVNEQNYNYRR